MKRFVMRSMMGLGLVGLLVTAAGCYDLDVWEREFPCEFSDQCGDGDVCLDGMCVIGSSSAMSMTGVSTSAAISNLTQADAGRLCAAVQLEMVTRMKYDGADACKINAVFAPDDCIVGLSECQERKSPEMDPEYLCELINDTVGCQDAGVQVYHLTTCMHEIIDEEIFYLEEMTCLDPHEPDLYQYGNIPECQILMVGCFGDRADE